MKMYVKPLEYFVRDFQRPPAERNRIICLTHVIPGDDGGKPVVDFLQRAHVGLGGGRKLFVPNPRSLIQELSGKTFVIDVPYGTTVAQQADAFELPARYMTTPVMVLPVRDGLYDVDYMGLIARAIPREDPVAFVFGDISEFSPEDVGKEHFRDLSIKVRGLVNYVESRYGRPVVYLATGPYGPIISPWKDVE